MTAVEPARPRVRWWPRLSIAAAVVAAVLVAVSVIDRGAAPRGAMVEVAHTLNSAAAAQADTPVPAGKYRYIATESLDMAYAQGGGVTLAYLFGTRIETWVPADRTAEWTSRHTGTGVRTWLVGTAEQARSAGLLDEPQDPEVLRGRCGAFHPDAGVDPCARVGNWQSPTDAFAAGLPRDPQELFDLLRDDTAGRGSDRDQEVLVYAADALRGGLLPADLRAALYRALSLLPTLIVTERSATLDGRTGTALGIDAKGEWQEIIIDPATGAFIGERSRLTADMGGIPAGTVVGSRSVRYGIADKAGVPASIR